MYDLTIRSIFRDSSSYTYQYFYQMKAFIKALPPHWKIHLALLEGDSVDGTYELLEANLKKLESLFSNVTYSLVKFEVNQPMSLTGDSRMQRIATAWNKNLETIKVDSDRNIIVESDLIWDGGTMSGMVSNFNERNTAIAPMLLHENGPDNLGKYDTWGFRRGAFAIDGAPEYWKQTPEDRPHDLWLIMEKIGGFILCDREAMEMVVWDKDTCILNWGHSTLVYQNRGAVVMHPRWHHPTSGSSHQPPSWHKKVFPTKDTIL
jgi:hypothetical protein